MERRRALLIGITIFGEGLDNFSPTLEDVQVMKKCLEDKDKSFVSDVLNTLWEGTDKHISGPKLENTSDNIAPVPNPGK